MLNFGSGTGQVRLIMCSVRFSSGTWQTLTLSAEENRTAHELRFMRDNSTFSCSGGDLREGLPLRELLMQQILQTVQYLLQLEMPAQLQSRELPGQLKGV